MKVSLLGKYKKSTLTKNGAPKLEYAEKGSDVYFYID